MIIHHLSGLTWKIFFFFATLKHRHCFFSSFYCLLHSLPEEEKIVSMMNIISGRLHTRAEIWGDNNNVLIDNVASLYRAYYIF